MNHRQLFQRATLITPLALALLAGCGEKPVQPTPPSYDPMKATALCDLGHVVIVPAVTDFAAASDALLAAIGTLNAQRTQQSLDNARGAWRAARRPWELSEAFLFGPGKNQQLDPAIDSWPLDRNTLEDILQGGDPITKEYLAPLEGTAKGFHAIEFLIFGEEGTKSVEKITDREYEYLLAAAAQMNDAASRLREAWEPSNGDESTAYTWQICNAGKEGSLYRIQAAGMAEVVNQLVSLSSELENAKMGNPYFGGTTEFEEARYSGNSKADFLANVEGLRAVYTGEYRERSGGTKGTGLSDVVKAADPQLDAKVRAQLDEAARRIENIAPSFGGALTGGNKSTINSAITAVRDLGTMFDIDVRAVLVKR